MYKERAIKYVNDNCTAVLGQRYAPGFVEVLTMANPTKEGREQGFQEGKNWEKWEAMFGVALKESVGIREAYLSLSQRRVF